MAQCAACVYGLLNAHLAVTVAAGWYAPLTRVARGSLAGLCLLESACWLFVALACFSGYCAMLDRRMNSLRALVVGVSSLVFQLEYSTRLGVTDPAALAQVALLCLLAPLCVLGLEHTMFYCTLLQTQQVRDVHRAEVVFHYALCLFLNGCAHAPNLARAARAGGVRLSIGVACVAALFTLPLMFTWGWCAGRASFQTMDLASFAALLAAKGVFLESLS